MVGPIRAVIAKYALTDGRVVERIFPEPARKASSLRPGQKVLVWHNPEDRQEVLVCGREGRLADRAFVAIGVLFMPIGMGIAAYIR